jgi:hypothetical protein
LILSGAELADFLFYFIPIYSLLDLGAGTLFWVQKILGNFFGDGLKLKLLKVD